MPFLQPDYTPFSHFESAVFTDVAHDALAFV